MSWEAWESFAEVTPAFIDLVLHPKELTSEQLNIISKFVIITYDKHSETNDIDVCRMQLFAQKNRTVENLPPTMNALALHIKRCIFQAGFVWGNLCQPVVELPCPSKWGWTLQNNKWTPLWTTTKNEKISSDILLKCKCKTCGPKCKCFLKNLKCTRLCLCVECCN